MQTVNVILNATVGRLIELSCRGGEWLGLAAVAFLCAVLILLLFRMVSNPVVIRRRRDRAVARLLELVVFRHDPVVGLGALGRVVLADLAYLGTMVVPALVSAIPVVLIIAQVNARFENRPLRAGETTVLKACLPASIPVMDAAVDVRTSGQMKVETVSVRIPAQNQVSWRLKAGEPGTGWIDLEVAGKVVRKSVHVGEARGAALQERRARKGAWGAMMNPGEPALTASDPVLWVEVAYPRAQLHVAGFSCHWLLAFVVMTMGMAWLIRKPLGVEL